MNVYIWGWTKPVSINYHPEGGLLIIAADIEAARELWAAHCVRVTLEPGAADADPDLTYHLDPAATVEPGVMTFPDAGCC